MTFLLTEPQALASVAANVEHIGWEITSADATTANPISGVVAAADDEVSAAVAQLFGAYGKEYQALLTQAAAFHRQFTQTLAAAGNAYAAAEAAASNTLGTVEAQAPSLSGTGTAAAGGVPFANPPLRLPSPVTLVMGGTGNPLPDFTFISGVVKWATLSGFPLGTVQAIFTPENLYPLTGVRSLTLNTSVSQGVQNLDLNILQNLAVGNSVLVQGYSQSSIIASIEMQHLLALPSGAPSGSQLAFNLLGDPMNPNGGLLERFTGLTMPSLGLDFYGATPANTPWQTAIYSLEYDGFADFPRYPIDLLSDLNAVAGIVYVHPLYPQLDPLTLPAGSIVQLPVQSGYTGPLANTSYYMVLTQNLPLLDPLRAVPFVGNPLADLLQPDLKVLVNLGYGDPNYGYSTSPANVPTPFGLFPPINPAVLATDLITGTQQGFVTAGSDIVAEGLLSPPVLPQSLPSITLPSPNVLVSPPSIGGIIHTLETATTKVLDTVSDVATAGYSVLLPTADILNAAVTVIPAYDINLFLDGIAQAAGGDPVGLINAIGDPLAATTGLVTVAGGVEGLVLLEAGASIVRDLSSL